VVLTQLGYENESYGGTDKQLKKVLGQSRRARGREDL
jgi:hypothetical protein